MRKIDVSLIISLIFIIIPVMVAISYLDLSPNDWKILFETFLALILVVMFVIGTIMFLLIIGRNN